MKLIHSIAALLLLSGCSDRSEAELGYSCGDTISATIFYSSALIYGIDAALPVVTGTFPIDEGFLQNIEVGDSKHPTLIAVNGEERVFQESCDKLCDMNDALGLIAQCRNTPDCTIVGGVKNSAFHPFYTSDRDGGHLCSRKQSG